jgi:hypothetical protein
MREGAAPSGWKHGGKCLLPSRIGYRICWESVGLSSTGSLGALMEY